jgi:aldehyde:ferredoxin oxidoreductase
MISQSVFTIDLTREKTWSERIDPDIQRKFVGGKGIAAYLLFKNTPPLVDPLSEENILILATGPLTGTFFPQNRSCIVSKSPLSYTFCDSYIGGQIGPEIRFSGYDYIVVKGRSENLVHIHIHDDDVDIASAHSLQGKGSLETEKTVRETNRDSKVLAIGPAGEKCVRFASISTEYFRHAGRGGLGAVMGSKKVKAISFRGTGGVEIADARFFKEAERLHHSLKDSPANQGRRMMGTARSITSSSRNVTLPTRNFRSGVYEKVDRISAETMSAAFWKKRRACFVCPTNCSALGIISEGKRRGTVQEGVDYENLGMLGSNLDIDDIDEIIFMNYLCDDLGLDTISTGNIIGFLMECTEKRVENLPVEIAFGDSQAALDIIMHIAKREAFGDVLAEGLHVLARQLHAEDFAMHVKGLELPAWEVRSAVGMALAYATADRGGCHRRAFPLSSEVSGQEFEGHVLQRFSTEKKAALVKKQQDIGCVYYSLIVCGFCTGLIEDRDFFDLTNMATGSSITDDEFWTIGERIWNLTRLYNIREGHRRAADTLPNRFFADPLMVNNEGHVVNRDDFEQMLDEYYELRGWDHDGIPTKDTIKRLGLEDFRVGTDEGGENK